MNNTSNYLSLRRKSLMHAVLKLREECKLTQQDIADLLQCPVNRILSIERGEEGYTLEELELISLRLGKLPQDLITIPPGFMTSLYQHYTNDITYAALGEKLLCDIPSDCCLLPEIDNDELIPPQVFFSLDSSFMAAILGRMDRCELEATVLCVWERATGRMLARIDADWYITAVAFSPDSNLVAFAAERDSVWLWNWREGRQVAVLDAVEDGYSQAFWANIDSNNLSFGEITHILWTIDNKYILTYNSGHGILRLWEPDFAGWKNSRILSMKTIGKAALKMIPLPYESPDSIAPHPISIYKFHYLPGENTLFIYPADYHQDVIYQLPLDADSRTPLLICEVARHFSILGFDLLPIPAFDEWPYSYVQVIVGSNGFEEYVLRQASEYKFSFTTLARYEDPRPFDYYHVVALNLSSILALTAIHEENTEEVDWVLTNVVTNQSVALPDLDRKYHRPTPHRNLITPDGQSVVYLKDNNIHIQQIRPEVLVPVHYPIPDFQEELEFHANFCKTEKSKLSSFISQLDVKEFFSEVRETDISNYKPEEVPEDAVQKAVLRWKKTNPMKDGGFGITALPSDDVIVFASCMEKLAKRTQENLRVVDAADMGEAVSVRQLVSLIIEQELLNGEFTQDVTEKLIREKPYSLIVIDHSENLTFKALEWVYKHQRNVTDAFLLVIRQDEKFGFDFHTANRNVVYWIMQHSFLVNLFREVYLA